MAEANHPTRDGRLRSFWQVLAVYGGVSWVVLQVVDVLKNNMGLPDWVFPFAVVLLLIGLPIILATALVQRRPAAPAIPEASVADAGTAPAAGPPPEDQDTLSPRRLFTWRNALLGGAAAFVLLAAVTTGFMFMRNRGIGPVGSLVAKGLIDERSEILVADFDAADEVLGRMAAEALRVDLSQSEIVRLVEPRTVEEALRRMERAPETRIDEALAREIAVREGIPAVVGGQVLAGGGSYVIAAHLLTAGGDLLANARVTASDSTDIIGAIDRLSGKLREQIGESYTSMRKSPPLEQVTTASLEALRKYTLAGVQRQEGNIDAATGLLEEALEIDSTFAMAYRGIGVLLQNQRRQWSRQEWAYRKAYEYRDRLTEREKWLVTAAYFMFVEEDPGRAIAAYENVLRVDPDNVAAVNNTGVVYYFQRDWENALKWYSKANEMQPAGLTAANVGVTLANLGRLDEAVGFLDDAIAREPNHPSWRWWRAQFDQLRGDPAEAERRVEDLKQSETANPAWLNRLELTEWAFAARTGHLGEAAKHLQAALVAVERSEGPETLVTLLRKAELELALGHQERARAAVRQALERHPIGEFEPLDRPTAQAVYLLAMSGAPGEARDLLDGQRGELGPDLAGRSHVGFGAAEGWIALAEGDYESAIARLRGADEGYACQPCVDHSLGRAFDLAGQPDSAIAYYEKYLEPAFNFRVWVDGVWRGWTLERLGQLYDEKGDVERAAGYFGMFVDLWADADPELQARVRAARARIEEIARQRG